MFQYNGGPEVNRQKVRRFFNFIEILYPSAHLAGQRLTGFTSSGDTKTINLWPIPTLCFVILRQQEQVKVVNIWKTCIETGFGFFVDQVKYWRSFRVRSFRSKDFWIKVECEWLSK